jgi:hypothetical protein
VAVHCGVNPDNIDKTIALIREEIIRFITEPVSIEELADSQANYWTPATFALNPTLVLPR